MNSAVRSGPPVTGGELTTFVTNRLREVGAESPLFTPDALDLLVAYSNGSVRQLDHLLRLTLFLASTENAASVDSELVKKAVATTRLPRWADRGRRTSLRVTNALRPFPEDRLAQPSSSDIRPGFSKTHLIEFCLLFSIAIGTLLFIVPRYDGHPAEPNRAPTMPAASLPAKIHGESVSISPPASTPDISASHSAKRNMVTSETARPSGGLSVPFPRVIIDFAGDGRFSEYQAESLGNALRAIGFHVIAVVRQQSVPVQSVRYYYPSDVNFAKHVAQTLGEDWRSRIVLAPNARQAVYPGLVRVFIPGD